MRCLSRTDKKKLQAIIAANIEKLRAIPGFVGVRPGFPIVDGRVVKQPAIVVYVSHKRAETELSASEIVPRSLEDVRVDVVQADPERQLRAREEFQALAAALDDAALALSYRGIAGDPIECDVQIETPIVCHAGPDAGWPVLKSFLAATRRTLSVAMYDFNASWISSAFVEAMQENDIAVTLMWDDGMNDDESTIRRTIKRELGDKLDAWLVRCGKGRRFASAYHEKVVVRDSASMWISSGNWSRRSQPDIDPVADDADAKGMYSGTGSAGALTDAR